MYILDTISKSNSRLDLPLQILDVTTVGCFVDSVVLGCTISERSKFHNTRENILELSLKQGIIMTIYIMPCLAEIGNDTKITQVWKNDLHLIGLTYPGLFMFDTCTEENSIIVEGPAFSKMPCFMRAMVLSSYLLQTTIHIGIDIKT